MPDPPILIIAADDYGYWPSYNRGILKAIEREAIDSVGVMVEREHCEPEPLLETGIEIGLHLEFEGRWGRRSGKPAGNALHIQLDRFSRLFKRWPDYIDGHRNCHARPELLSHVADMAGQLKIPVRSVNRRHRELLRERGIATQDHLIGRSSPAEPLPDAALKQLDPGVTIWFTHPGYPDPDSKSSYNQAREEDLDMLISLTLRTRAGDSPLGDVRRATHREALAHVMRETARETQDLSGEELPAD